MRASTTGSARSPKVTIMAARRSRSKHLLEERRGVEQGGHGGVAEREQHLVGLEVARLEPAQGALDHVLEARPLDERAQEALGEVARALLALLVRVRGEAHEHAERLVVALLRERALGERRDAAPDVEIARAILALVELAQQHVHVRARRHLAQIVERGVLGQGRRTRGDGRGPGRRCGGRCGRRRRGRAGEAGGAAAGSSPFTRMPAGECA